MSTLLEQASLVMIPSGYKEDVVYSQIPTDGSGDLSFTRASNGTRINSAGLVEVCPWNLLLNTDTFSSWNLEGGTLTSSQTDPNGGTTAYKYVQPTFGSGLWSTLNLPVMSAGTGATLSIWAKSVSGSNVAFYLGSGYSATGGATKTATSEWQLFTVSYAFADGGSMYINNISDTTNGIYLWHPQVNVGLTAKPYFPTTDRLNVPRLTYQNGGGGCPSLLLEKQSTNLVTYSEQFDNAGWLKLNGAGGSAPVVTPNYALSPDGTMNADRVQLARTTQTFSYSEIKQNFGTTGTQYTVSVYLKSLSGNPTISMANDGATFNFLATLTSEWVRYTATFTASGTPSAELILYEQVTSSSLTADFLVWGFQVEASSYPTSYIPTTSASATRVADYPSRSGLALTNFTFAVNFKPLAYVVELFDFEKTGGGRMFYVAVQSNGFITFNSVSGGTIGAIGSVLTINQTCKLAFKLNASTSNLTVFINGSNIGTYTTNITTFGAFFGLQSFGYNPGTQIEQIAIFPSVLTDAECISLTTI